MGIKFINQHQLLYGLEINSKLDMLSKEELLLFHFMFKQGMTWFTLNNQQSS